MVTGMIGLEIHVYVTTREKLFCRCRAQREKGQEANISVCPVCTGQPGAKPRAPNEDAVRKAVQIALMLGCRVNRRVLWFRKHYDWPDLPKGYQTTISGAHAQPLGVNGEFRGIAISGMHLEEDPAAWNPQTGGIDYNRSGLPLVEIVTAPDFTTAEETVAWLQKLLHLLKYLKAVDVAAGIKVDVNVNIPGKTERVEVKNVHSLEGVKQTIEYELKRQEREGSVRETRRFDEKSGKTARMRGKEDAADYRFIADPDLPPLVLAGAYIADIEKQLPVSPDEKIRILTTQYSLSETDAGVLAKHLDVAEFFERVARTIDGKFALPWVTVELLRVLNYNKKELSDVSIDVEHFVTLLRMVQRGTITELQAKQLLNRFVPASFDPSDTQGKVDNEGELKSIIHTIIKTNPGAVDDYKKGDEKALNFLLGQVMKATERRADFKVARKVLEEALA